MNLLDFEAGSDPVWHSNQKLVLNTGLGVGMGERGGFISNLSIKA